MKTVKLCLHAGGSEVDFDALKRVSTPSATDTWTPIPHDDLVTRVRAGLGNANLEIVGETHALAKDGARYFGLFQVAQPGIATEDYSLVMGLRNSHDKMFPAGITVGSQVFVCDNLAFSGEIKLSRKHTTHIFRDLPGKVSEAIGRLSNAWVAQETRFQAYKAASLTDTKDLHDILVRAILNKAITKTQLTDVLNEWNSPSHEEFGNRNVWSLFNAFTQVAKGNLDALPARTMALTGLLDGYCGLMLPKA